MRYIIETSTPGNLDKDKRWTDVMGSLKQQQNVFDHDAIGIRRRIMQETALENSSKLKSLVAWQYLYVIERASSHMKNTPQDQDTVTSKYFSTESERASLERKDHMQTMNRWNQNMPFNTGLLVNRIY